MVKQFPHNFHRQETGFTSSTRYDDHRFSSHPQLSVGLPRLEECTPLVESVLRVSIPFTQRSFEELVPQRSGIVVWDFYFTVSFVVLGRGSLWESYVVIFSDLELLFLCGLRRTVLKRIWSLKIHQPFLQVDIVSD